jgi:drug/metabolite transporter (DMT)-like permease
MAATHFAPASTGRIAGTPQTAAKPSQESPDAGWGLGMLAVGRNNLAGSPVVVGSMQDRSSGVRFAALPGLRDDRLKGILCLAIGIAVFSIQDVILKLLSGAYPLHQAMFIRSVVALPLLLAVVGLEGGLGSLRSGRPWTLTGRGLLNFVAYTTFYLGLAALPIATGVALFFSAPLFITLLSVAVLRERVGVRRWTAVIVGFLGVIIMMRPGSDIFDWAALLPVLGALAYAFSQIIARRIGETASAGVMTFYSNGFFLVTAILLAAVFGSGSLANEEHRSLAFLLRGWSVPTLTDFLLMAFCGAVAAAGLVLLTQAYRVAPANVVAPFEYTALIWGVLYGWLFWSELPDAWSWVGIATIVLAGLYVLYRERRIAGAPGGNQSRVL